MENKCYIAAAGAGKTSFIIKTASQIIKENPNAHIAIITYTRRNQDGILDRLRELHPKVARSIRVYGWYEFLFKYIIRPYKGTVIEELYDHNVSLLWSEASQTIKVNGKNIARYRKGDKKKKYLAKWKIYKNYVSEFANECIDLNRETCLSRLNRIYSHIMIDECQDLSGYDLNIVGALCKTNINILAVGDPRQYTYKTNNLRVNGKYDGRLDLYLREKVNKKGKQYILIDDVSLNVTHRCGKKACSVASTLHLEYPNTVPCTCSHCKEKRNKIQNGHDEVYWVASEFEEAFIEQFSPTALTHDKNRKVNAKILERINMGESKGLGRTNCLIYPTNPMLQFLKTKEPFTDTEMAKLYVALTRATHIVGILVPSKFKSSAFELPYWHPDDE